MLHDVTWFLTFNHPLFQPKAIHLRCHPPSPQGLLIRDLRYRTTQGPLRETLRGQVHDLIHPVIAKPLDHPILRLENFPLFYSLPSLKSVTLLLFKLSSSNIDEDPTLSTGH